MKVDFTGENYENKEILPEGDYGVEVKDVKILTGKISGKPYFLWTLEVIDGEFTGKIIESKTTTIKGKRWLFKQALACCGIPTDDVTPDFTLDNLIGKIFTVKLGIKKDADWTGSDGVVRKSDDKNEVKKFFIESESAKTDPTFESKKEEDPELIPF